MEGINKYLKDYLEYLIDIKKYSIHTVKAYKLDIKQFLNFLNIQLSDVGPDNIRDFISHVFLYSQNKSTIARKIYVLRAFFSYLINAGKIPDNPMDSISVPKIDKKLPKILTENEMNSFLDKLPQDTFLQIRNKAMFEFLYATGLRVSELTALKISNINFPKRILRTLGKGKKERLIPFTHSSKQYLEKYLQAAREKFKITHKYVFLNFRGHPITERSVERILKKEFNDLMDSKTNVYPHLFRHSFATHLLQRGANLRIIQELLGHSNLSTTEKYTSLNYSDLLKTYSQFHPRA